MHVTIRCIYRSCNFRTVKTFASTNGWLFTWSTFTTTSPFSTGFDYYYFCVSSSAAPFSRRQHTHTHTHTHTYTHTSLQHPNMPALAFALALAHSSHTHTHTRTHTHTSLQHHTMPPRPRPLPHKAISELCTNSTCPMMSAGPKYTYLWADGVTIKTPIKLPACDYINYLMEWVDVQVFLSLNP